MNTKLARLASKLTAITLLASTVLATGCAAPLDDDAAEDKTENIGTSEQALVVADDVSPVASSSTPAPNATRPPSRPLIMDGSAHGRRARALYDGLKAVWDIAQTAKGDVHMTATNASAGPLAILWCSNNRTGECFFDVLAPGESFEKTFGNDLETKGGLKGAMLVPNNAGNCPELNLDGQTRSWCSVSLASWNPVIGEPKIALASMSGTTATEFAFSQNGTMDVRSGAGLNGVDLFNPKKATVVPYEAQLKRSADSSGNTKEMSITVTRVHPRQSAYNLATGGWFTGCNSGNKCDLIDL